MEIFIGKRKKSLDKVKRLADRLEEATGKKFPLYVLNHEANQTLIKERCENHYQCVMCKRTMQFVAREFSKRNGCSGIIMGDSLGQVASQTLRNIRAEGSGLNFPIVRPLIGMAGELERAAPRGGGRAERGLHMGPGGVLGRR